MDLAAALQRIDPLGRRRHLIAVEVGRPLLELREVLDALQRPLRAEKPLNVHAAQAGRVDAAAVRLRPDVADEVRRPGGVAVDVAVEAGDALHAVGLRRLAVGRGVELLLRELRHQQSQALQVLGVEDALEDLLEVLHRDELALRHVAEVGPSRQEDGRRELRQERARAGRNPRRSAPAAAAALISICGKTMPPTSCLGCGSGRKPAGKTPLSLTSSGDISASFSQVMPSGSRTAGPTGIGLPRVIFTCGVRVRRQVVALLEQLLLAGHDLRFVRLVLRHHFGEGLLAEQHGRDLVVAAGRRLGRLVRGGLRRLGRFGLVRRPGLEQRRAGPGQHHRAEGRIRQPARPTPFRGSEHENPPVRETGGGGAVSRDAQRSAWDRALRCASRLTGQSPPRYQ